MKHGGLLGADPADNGLYVAEVYHGWKLLEWHNGAWWHMELVGRWTACKPVQWVGPLPKPLGQKPKMDFDL